MNSASPLNLSGVFRFSPAGNYVVLNEIPIRLLFFYFMTSLYLPSNTFGYNVGGIFMGLDRIMLLLFISVSIVLGYRHLALYFKYPASNAMVFTFSLLISTLIFIFFNVFTHGNADISDSLKRSLFYFIQFGIFSLAVFLSIRITRHRKESILRSFCSVIFICCVVSITQLVFDFNLTKILDLGILQVNDEMKEALETRDYRSGITYRIMGNTAHPIELAVISSIGLLLSSYVYRKFRPLYLLVVVAALFLTYSRGPVLSLGLTLVVLYIASFKIINYYRVIIACICVAVIALSPARNLIFPEGDLGSDRSISLRSGGYITAPIRFYSSPLFGIGIGNYNREYRETKSEAVRENSDNYFLLSLAETGLIGIVGFLTIFLRKMRKILVSPLAVAITVFMFIQSFFYDTFAFVISAEFFISVFIVMTSHWEDA